MTYRLRNIALAIGLALVAMLLTLLYVKNVRRSAQTDVANVQIYVAGKDLAAGTSGAQIVKHGDLRIENVQKRDVVPGAISSPAQVDSLMLAAPLYQGEQVTLRRFTNAAAEGIRAQLTGTMRAVQVAGDANQLLSGTLDAGDRVDLVANLHLTSTDGSASTATRIVLRNLRVLSTDGGDSAKVATTSSGNSDSVILAVTDAQVQRLFFVLKNADWTLELRPVLNPADGAGRTETAESVHEGRLVMSDAIRVYATGDCDGFEGLCASLAESGEVEVVGASGDVRTATATLAGGHLDCVLHGTREGTFPAAELATIREHTRAPVILVASGAEAAAMLEQALETDVTDVLLLPQLTQNVIFAIRKASHARRQLQTPAHRGRVITIFSPKGGTGKTVVSTNLAAALAKNERKRTLLIDLDLQFGDAAIMLGLEPTRRSTTSSSRRANSTPRSLPGTSPGTRPGSTSSRRRFAPRTPSSSPRARSRCCSKLLARRTRRSSSTRRRSSTARCSPRWIAPTSCSCSAASTCRR